jgi:hypothetical protein
MRSLVLDLLLLTVVARAALGAVVRGAFVRTMFDRLVFRFVTARADPETPVTAAGAKAGAARNAAARSGIRSLRDMMSSPGRHEADRELYTNLSR